MSGFIVSRGCKKLAFLRPIEMINQLPQAALFCIFRRGALRNNKQSAVNPGGTTEDPRNINNYGGFYL